MKFYTLFNTGALSCEYFQSTERAQNQNPVLIVNFAPMKEVGRVHAVGDSGQEGRYFLSRGCDVLSIHGSENSVYQDLTPGLAERIAGFIGLIREKYSSVIGYGSSMGGFGAILFSKMFMLDKVLTFSPFYDVRFSWEPRWRFANFNGDWHNTMSDDVINPSCSYTIFYDPMDLDKEHVDRYRKIIPEQNLYCVELPFAGHSSVCFLSETGWLKKIAKALIGKSELPGKKEIIADRIRSYIYLKNLASECERRNKPSWSLQISKLLSQMQVPSDTGYLTSRYERRAILKPVNAHNVTTAYQIILGREPESSDIVQAHIEANETLSDIRQSFIQSDEFKSYYDHVRYQMHADCTSISSMPPDGSLAYKIMKLNMLSLRTRGRGITAFDLDNIKMSTIETKPVGVLASMVFGRCGVYVKKILLLGAYGNGNLGDDYQAVFMQNHLISLGIAKENIYAASAFGVNYEFDEMRKISPDLLFDPEYINQNFDALLIGGGGLMAHIHHPLDNNEWVEHLNIPVALIGIGTGNDADVLDKQRAIVDLAWCVSGRDLHMVSELSKYRNDVLFMADPIFSGSIDSVEVQSNDISYDNAWILKYPHNDHDSSFLDEVKTRIKKHGANDIVIFVEPIEDEDTAKSFSDITKVVSTKHLETLLSIIKRSDRVISMRYHGAIAACLADKAVFGFCSHTVDKIKFLFDEYHIRGAHFQNIQQLDMTIDFSRDSNCDTGKAKQQFTEGLRGILATIGVLPCDNQTNMHKRIF